MKTNFIIVHARESWDGEAGTTPTILNLADVHKVMPRKTGSKIYLKGWDSEDENVHMHKILHADESFDDIAKVLCPEDGIVNISEKISE